MAPWIEDKDNIMLGFILEKKEELTDELLEEFKEIFRERFGLEPTDVEIGKPERHVYVGRMKGKNETKPRHNNSNNRGSV